VDVNVDQAGGDVAVGCVDDSISAHSLDVRRDDALDLAVANKQVRLALELLSGIEDCAVLDEKRGHKCKCNREGAMARRTDAKGLRGVDDALDAITKQRDVEVDEQSELQPHSAQVRQQLCSMNVVQCLDDLEFKDEDTADK
jgi:hypothetical protein